MTKEKISGHLISALCKSDTRAVNVEMKKTRLGAVLVCTNILAVREISGEKIILLSHSGTITVNGDRLMLSVFEDRSIKIFGRINGVELGYGKNN